MLPSGLKRTYGDTGWTAGRNRSRPVAASQTKASVSA